MRELKERIVKDGEALNEHVLKVDSFINHQVDPKLMSDIGAEFARYFKDYGITKVVTVESSGIAPSVFTALHMGVDLVVLKKSTSKILSTEILQTTVASFTKGTRYELTLSKKFLSPDDVVLFIDDFLANGQAATGAATLIEKAGAKVAGIGILIEKTFQDGHELLEKAGYHVYSLARVKKMSEGSVEFED